jgi:hypothetical protein
MSFLEGKGKRHAAAKLAETGYQTRPRAVGGRHRQDTFHDSFCRDLDDIESLVMATQVLELITNAASAI